MSTVERLTIGRQDVEAVGLPAPPAAHEPRTPVAAIGADFDGDTTSDILVHDTCGSYLVSDVRSASPAAVDAAEYFPNADAFPFLEFDLPGEDAAAQLAIGLPNQYEFFSVPAGETRWRSLAILTLDQWPTTNFTRGIVPTNTPGTWLVQLERGLQLVSVEAGEPATLTSKRFVQSSVELPYLVPFDGFDHLEVLGTGACGTLAVGVGQFSDTTDIPRHVVLLTLPDQDDESGEFSARQLASSSDVVTVAVAHQDDSNRMVLGVLGTEGNSHVLEVYEYVLCESARSMGRARVDFDVRYVPTPGFYEVTARPPTNGVKLVAVPDGDSVAFFHYDGYDVRRFSVDTSKTPWTIVNEVLHVHDDRLDLSVP